MSKKSLRDCLSQTLSRQPHEHPLRLAVLGIGNELYGDDAAGILAARILSRTLPVSEQVLVIEAGTAPENCTGTLRQFRPDLVLLIDAAQMNETTGTVQWLAWQAADGISASTHTLPLHMLSQYLHTELGCEVALIGVQPAGNRLFAPVSAAVQHAVEEIAEELSAALSIR